MADSAHCQSKARIHRNPPFSSRNRLFNPRELLFHKQSDVVVLCFHVYRRDFNTLGHYANIRTITAITDQFSDPRGFVFSHVELFVLTPTEFCLTPYTIFPGSFLRLPAFFLVPTNLSLTFPYFSFALLSNSNFRCVIGTSRVAAVLFAFRRGFH